MIKKYIASILALALVLFFVSTAAEEYEPLGGITATDFKQHVLDVLKYDETRHASFQDTSIYSSGEYFYDTYTLSMAGYYSTIMLEYNTSKEITSLLVWFDNSNIEKQSTIIYAMVYSICDAISITSDTEKLELLADKISSSIGSILLNDENATEASFGFNGFNFRIDKLQWVDSGIPYARLFIFK